MTGAPLKKSAKNATEGTGLRRNFLNMLKIDIVGEIFRKQSEMWDQRTREWLEQEMQLGREGKAFALRCKWSQRKCGYVFRGWGAENEGWEVCNKS